MVKTTEEMASMSDRHRYDIDDVNSTPDFWEKLNLNRGHHDDTGSQDIGYNIQDLRFCYDVHDFVTAFC